MDEQHKSVERVIGFDCHPDSFTAAILRGSTPASAIVEKTFNKVPIGQLEKWAKKNTTAEDLFVLEASGNSFQVVRTLAQCERKAKVLESCQMGKLKEAHANNDQISAVRIGKAYLAGTAKEVWVPDVKAQERRDWFHAHRKANKRLTQMQARVRSYLSDNGVRLKKGTRLTQAAEVKEQIRKAKSWSDRQWQVIELYLDDLCHADQQRRHWRSLIAQEVLDDPDLLAIVRLCGIREMNAFALAAFIGDIKRFKNPKKLVKYVGLNPAFDDSGNSQWSGGIGGHGNNNLRCLLIEGAHAILRSSNTSLAKWGKKLLRSKGSVNLAVAAIARKLTVSVWYLMMGQWTPIDEIDVRLCVKVSKIIGQIGKDRLKSLGKTSKILRQEAYTKLKASSPVTVVPVPAKTASKPSPQATVYILKPGKKFTQKSKSTSLAEEYGLR